VNMTDSLVAHGKVLEDTIMASPVGAALDSLQAMVVDQIISVYPEFPAFVDNFAKEYRFEYHNHIQVALMNPFHVVLITLAYLVLVYGGMAVMKRTTWKAELKLYGIIHNLVLTSVSLFMCVEIFRQAYLLGYSFAGNIGIHQPQEHQVGFSSFSFFFFFFFLFSFLFPLTTTRDHFN